MTATPSVTRTPTPTLPISEGPRITFFGLATAFNTVLTASSTDAEGRPVYVRPAGAGFFIIVEARPGSSGSTPGLNRYPPVAPDGRPDLQIEATHDLGTGAGKGSPAVCDSLPSGNQPAGGVPGVDPPNFDPSSETITDILNDFGCRLDRRTAAEPCTLNASENFAFVRPDTTVQYCTISVVGTELKFPTGDTVLTVQVRDGALHIGFPKQLVVRVP